MPVINNKKCKLSEVLMVNIWQAVCSHLSFNIFVQISIIKPNRCTDFTNLFCHETLHALDSSSVHHHEFIYCTLSNGICHTNLYDICQCTVNKLVMMDRGTV